MPGGPDVQVAADAQRSTDELGAETVVLAGARIAAATRSAPRPLIEPGRDRRRGREDRSDRCLLDGVSVDGRRTDRRKHPRAGRERRRERRARG